MAHGRFSYIAVAKETTKGVKPATINNFLKYSGGGFELDAGKIESKALTGRLLKQDTAIGTRSWKGKINGVELDSTGQGVLFKSLFGSETVTGASPPYTHSFKFSVVDDYISIAVEQYKVEWLRYFLNTRVAGVSIKGELNSFITADFDLISAKMEEGNITDKQNVSLTGNSFRFYEANVKVNNIEMPVKNFEVNIAEKVDADFNFMGGLEATGLMRGGVEATAKFSLNLSETSLEFWNKYLGENDVAISVELIKDANNKLIINLPRCRVNDYKENDGDEILKSDVSFEVLSYGTISSNIDPSIELQLINSQSEAY